MSSYPVAYRSGSRKYGGAPRAGAKAFKLPRPYTVPVKPPGANDNFPRPANDNIRKARNLARLTRAGKLISRRIPYIGYALIAWDLWELWRWYHRNDQAVGPFTLPGGFIQQNTCTPAKPYTHYDTLNGTGPWASTFCLANQLSSGAIPVGTPLVGNPGKIRFYTRRGTQPGGAPRYIIGEYFYRNSTSPSIQGQTLQPWLQTRPAIRPGRNFQLDPMNLPIKWPVEYPDPPPTALAPHRLDHPFIRQTGNDAVPRPRFTVRRPPPPGDKEVKLGGRGGPVRVILALQKVMHGTTEALDALDALHDALPKEFRAKGRYIEGLGWRKAPPQEKALAIWRHINEMNWEQAAINLAKNEIGDRILGRANARVDDFLNRSPIGRINRGFAF